MDLDELSRLRELDDENRRLKQIVAQQDDNILPMDRGRYCWITVTDGICTDDLSPFYGQDDHILVVGQTLELLVDAPYPDTVDVSLHPGGDMLSKDTDIPLEATLGEEGSILVTVPEGIEWDFVLVAFPVWENSKIPNGVAFTRSPCALNKTIA